MLLEFEVFSDRWTCCLTLVLFDYGIFIIDHRKKSDMTFPVSQSSIIIEIGKVIVLLIPRL